MLHGQIVRFFSFRRNTLAKRIGLCFVVLALFFTTSPKAFADPGPYQEQPTLAPVGTLEIYHPVPINIVFVGFEPGEQPSQIDESSLRQILPSFSVPIMSFGTDTKEGTFQPFYPIYYLYDYEVTFADEAFENALFSFMSDITYPWLPSYGQDLYNTQQARSLTISDNSWIYSPLVERWLAENTEPMMGVDTTQYTVFFINWYGRSDFEHHEYYKFEPDPDTGVPQGYNGISWGGTPELGLSGNHRIWFYDLSAGPTYWTGGWNLDDTEVPDQYYRLSYSNGIMDYRMPPIWEYGNYAGYRPFDSVTLDLGLVTRFVAINLLFTNCPIYRVLLPDRDLMPNDIEIDINVFNFDPTYDASTSLNPDLLITKLQTLQPYNNFSYERNFLDPPRRLSQVLESSMSGFLDFYNLDLRSRYGHRDPMTWLYAPIRDYVYYFEDHRMQYTEGDHAYELLAFTLALPDPSPDEQYPLRGIAEHNGGDLVVQEFVFNWTWPAVQSTWGQGQTLTMIHEVSHHLGLSHPHDGIDTELLWYYEGDDSLYFVWVGDESNTVMSYLTDGCSNAGFSQFDHDNMDRWVTWEYLNMCNSITERILESPRSSEVSDLLIGADQNAALALSSFQAMQYEEAVGYANTAFNQVMSAAETIRLVPLPGFAPGTWGTRALHRTPWYRQAVNDLRRSQDAIDMNSFRAKLTLEEFLEYVQQ